MDDPREARKLAANWRDYLTESKESYRVYQWAWREFVTPISRHSMKRGVVALVVMIALMMASPWLMKIAIDGLVAHSGSQVVYALVGFFVLWAAQRLLQMLFDQCREIALGEDQGWLDVRTSALFFGKSLGQHMQDAGLLNAANVEKGRGRVLEVEHMIVFDGIPLLVELTLAYTCLLCLSLVGGAGMTVLFLVYAAFMLFINRRVQVECTPIDAELRRFNRHRVERWENIDRVKTSGKEDEEVSVMTTWFARILRDDRRIWLWVIRICTVRGLINASMQSALMGYGAWLVWRGEWTVGLLFPFYQWTDAIGRNLWRLSQIEHRLNWNMPSVRSLMMALTIPPQAQDKDCAIALAPDRPVSVEFRDVAHGYGDTSALSDDDVGQDRQDSHLHVLKRVTFTVEPGEKVALMGPSGAGKTTVMRLLQRYMDPEHGSIVIDGHDLRDVQLASWKRLVGYIPQQAQVLDGTIRYNLLYGLSESERAAVTDQELWSVMRGLQIDFGERLTQGLDTVVGRRGIKLSGGQAQRLMIGAAVLKKPRFMIIDEATSSLDSTTEKAVQEGLAELLPPETSALIITHRLSTVRHLCSKFVVLRAASEVANGNGCQVEAVESSFEGLYAASGTFRRLADDQGVTVREDLRSGIIPSTK